MVVFLLASLSSEVWKGQRKPSLKKAVHVLDGTAHFDRPHDACGA